MPLVWVIICAFLLVCLCVSVSFVVCGGGGSVLPCLLVFRWVCDFALCSCRLILACLLACWLAFLCRASVGPVSLLIGGGAKKPCEFKGALTTTTKPDQFMACCGGGNQNTNELMAFPKATTTKPHEFTRCFLIVARILVNSTECRPGSQENPTNS